MQRQEERQTKCEGEREQSGTEEQNTLYTQAHTFCILCCRGRRSHLHSLHLPTQNRSLLPPLTCLGCAKPSSRRQAHICLQVISSCCFLGGHCACSRAKEHHLLQ